MFLQDQAEQSFHESLSTDFAALWALPPSLIDGHGFRALIANN
jgi:hypothetical protein